MRSAAFILLACLLLVDVRAMVISPKGRCYCKDRGLNSVKPELIQKVEVLYPSPSCQHMEIIVTLKGEKVGEQRCLNPTSHFAKNFIKNMQKERRIKK